MDLNFSPETMNYKKNGIFLKGSKKRTVNTELPYLVKISSRNEGKIKTLSGGGKTKRICCQQSCSTKKFTK